MICEETENTMSRRIPIVVIVTLVCACLAPGQMQRYTVAPENFSYVEGFGYVINMNLGEDGYKEGNKQSHLRLFEDGKELGPIDHLHRNILDKGEGRYSHWSRTSLFMSTSDNSDPRTNGRKYEIASDAFETVPAALAPAPAAAAPAPAAPAELLTDEQLRTLKRYPLDVDRIKPEQGFCYIASMDFGEGGYVQVKQTSGIRILEDGKPIGPVDHSHANIREKGNGRFSHWGAQSLYFSTSDNSDPRTNGRTYEIVSINPDNALGGITDRMSEIQTHTEVITSASHEYRVTLGGDLDMDNTLTRSHGGISVAFQPNISVTIANTGDTTVTWPKLVDNGRDWSSYETLLADFTRGATDDQEKALFIWQTMRDNRYHQMPLYPDDEFHDPVRMFNSYGLQLCDDMGYVGCSLFKNAGLGKPKYDIDPTYYSLYGHVQCEAVVDNKLQFLDIDQDVFYLDREGETPVSGDAVARDHDLVRREVHYGPVFGSWNSSESAAAIFGDDDTRGFMAVRGHEMRHSLRPGEQVQFRWDNVNKWVALNEQWDGKPVFWANSKFSYTPRLALANYKEGIAAETDIVAPTADGAELAGGSADAKLTYAFEIPWAVCGGTVRAEFVGLGENDRFALDFSRDGEKMTRIWEGGGEGVVSAEAPIDEALQPRNSSVAYKYFVVVSLASADAARGANLKSLSFDTDVMAAPLSLPRLRCGENVFAYSDQSEGAREVTITHEWHEVRGYPRLPAPAEPTSPPDGETITDSIVNFAWPAVENAGAYHIQVSKRDDFRVPYRVTYDVVISQPEWSVPYTGMFATDTTYYWRVRSRDVKGAWGDWGSTWTFTWQGPRVPLNVRAEIVGDDIVLRWDPNPRGERPVSYEVYGSNEKGFSVHKTEYTSYRRGTVPANFLADTTDTSMLVVSPDPTHENMNQCYYRVVAVDANGTQSICSDFAEMPHPHIFSRPPTEATVGQELTYQPGVISSLGDVQHRTGQDPVNDLWDREKLSFSLADGPGWLAIDDQTGALRGTPGVAGLVRVRIEVTSQFNKTGVQEFELTVR